MRHREFITLLGGVAAAWPLAARAQQPGRMPRIGVLMSLAEDDPDTKARLAGLRPGLERLGWYEGRNVRIDYRFALAAKAATTTIPIVFIVAEDPVRLGLVASLARPGGNATGINIFTSELVAKRLELLRELVPGAARIAVLVNPTNAAIAETNVRDVEDVARALGLQIQVFNVSTIREIGAAFSTFAHERPDALFVAGDPFLNSRRVQLAQLATFHRLPATYALRDYAEAGGLMSYGPNITDAWRQIGVYASRILKGAKPADLPVVQSNKFELVINAGTARMLGFTVPPTLLATADEVIE